jgi:hypothetical protein
VRNFSGPDWPPKLPGPDWLMPRDPFAEFRRPRHEHEKPQKRKRQPHGNSRVLRPPIVFITRVVISLALAAFLILTAVILVRQL